MRLRRCDAKSPLQRNKVIEHMKQATMATVKLRCEAYDLLLATHAPQAVARRGRATAQEGTLAWVIEQYKTSDVWTKELRASTKEVYDRHFDWLRKRCGAGDLRTMSERHVRALRNELKDRTTVADAVVGKIRMLWRFAKEHLGMDDLGPNPTVRLPTFMGRANRIRFGPRNFARNSRRWITRVWSAPISCCAIQGNGVPMP
jgi:hypothetical protein